MKLSESISVAGEKLPDTAAVIVGSLGSQRRVIFRKLGQSAGNAVIIEAIIAISKSGKMSAMAMAVVLGERNKGVKGMNSPVMGHNSRVSRFGKRGSSMAQSCRTESTSGNGMYREPHSASFRILRACFWKRAHSGAILNLSGDCVTERLKA